MTKIKVTCSSCKESFWLPAHQNNYCLYCGKEGTLSENMTDNDYDRQKEMENHLEQ